MINLAQGAAQILAALEANGFEAYVVGGCVRDSLLGRKPQDWDICTNARPDQVKLCFGKDIKMIETGLQHGTITILLKQEPYEITTYRVDGAYLDHRHPRAVKFVSSLREDLKRRDFTINAMAYHPKKGLVDYFGGCNDLEKKLIRCVGDPTLRFQEDGLRIMRALGFASVYGFRLAEPTKAALLQATELLHAIAQERISSQLCKLLLGEGAERVLLEYQEVLGVIIPELKPMFGFAQNHPYHYLDAWQHTAKSVVSAPTYLVLRLALLLHDLAKPACYEVDEAGIGRFYGHPQQSADKAGQILRRLRLDGATIGQVKALILYHDVDLQANSKVLKRWLNKLGEPGLRQLIQMQRADTMAKSPTYGAKRLLGLEGVESCLEQVLQQQQCFCLKDLAINGRDLLEIGVAEGAQIGITLHRLLHLVIEEQLENKREALLRAAKPV